MCRKNIGMPSLRSPYEPSVGRGRGMFRLLRLFYTYADSWQTIIICNYKQKEKTI